MTDTIIVVNLDSRPDRMEEFRAANPHVTEILRFSAFDGHALDRQQLLDDGLIQPDNQYSPPALGCGLSHLNIWRNVVESGLSATVFEDDAVIRHDFHAQRQALLARVADWDIVLWGWNLDWPVAIDLAPGLPDFFVESILRKPLPDLMAYQQNSTRPDLFRLHVAAGTLGYSIAPSGAAKLIERCLPLGNQMARHPKMPSMGWNNGGIDVEMSRHYRDLNAYLCISPLACTPNDWTTSNVRPPGAVQPE